MSEAKDFFSSPLKGSKYLTARSKAYGSTVRSTSQIQWLTQKRCTVTAKCGGIELSTKIGGGLPKSTRGSTSLYVQQEQGIYRPQPYITSVTVDTAGELGSLRQGKISFTANSLSQINSLVPFFQIGSDITISAAWSGAPTSITGPGYSFQGIVHNFSFTLNANGGFDCVTDFTGKGTNVLGANLGETSNKANTSSDVVKELNQAYLNLTNILTLIKQAQLGKIALNLGNVFSTKTNAFVTSNDASQLGNFGAEGMNSLGVIKLRSPKKFLSVDTNDRLQQSAIVNASDYANIEGDIESVYITLTTLLTLIESLTLGLFQDKSKFRIQCESQNIPSREPQNTDFSSANPFECIFPGYTKSTTADILTDPKIGKTNGAGIILINIDWLLNRLDQFAKNRESTDKNIIDTAFRFINDVFDMLKRNSGGFFKFTLVESKTVKETWLVVNNAYVNEDISYYNIPIQTYKGIARNVSLTGKLPSEMLAEAYVKARGDGTPNASQPGNSGLTATDVVNPSLKNDQTATVTIDYQTILAGGLTVAAVARLTSDMQKLVNADSDTSTNFASLVPLELSLTLDGIATVEYGNVFTVSYIPSNLTDPDRIFFMITQVTQNFSNTGDWTTDIKSIMRIRPSKTVPVKEAAAEDIELTEQQVAELSNSAYEQLQQDLSRFSGQDNTRTDGVIDPARLPPFP